MDCECTMTQIVGDGCEICNPEKALEIERENNADLEKQNRELVEECKRLKKELKHTNKAVETQAGVQSAFAKDWHKQNDKIKALVELMRGDCKYCRYTAFPPKCEGCFHGPSTCIDSHWEFIGNKQALAEGKE